MELNIYHTRSDQSLSSCMKKESSRLRQATGSGAVVLFGCVGVERMVCLQVEEN